MLNPSLLAPRLLAAEVESSAAMYKSRASRKEFETGAFFNESSTPREQVEASAVLDETRSTREEVEEQPSNVYTVVNPIAIPEIPIPKVDNPVAEVENPVISILTIIRVWINLWRKFYLMKLEQREDLWGIMIRCRLRFV